MRAPLKKKGEAKLSLQSLRKPTEYLTAFVRSVFSGFYFHSSHERKPFAGALPEWSFAVENKNSYKHYI